MIIRTLTEKENDIISTCIADAIAKDKKDSEAIFVNAFRTPEFDCIEVQFVKKNIPIKYYELDCPVERIIIRKIYLPSFDFHHGLNHYRERVNAKNLLNSDIIKDREDRHYHKLAEEAEEFGIGMYSNNVTFEPPLDFTPKAKTKKLK